MPRWLSPIQIVVVAFAFLAAVPQRRSYAQEPPCSTTVAAGGDVAEAVQRSAPGASVCLGAGVHRSFTITGPVAPGITVRGAGRGITVLLGPGDGILLESVSRFTIDNVTIRGGDATAVAGRTADALHLTNLRIIDAAVGIQIDGGSTAVISDVAVNDAADAAVVVADDAAATIERLSVEGGGIGLALLGNHASVVMRDSRFAEGAGAAVFAGIPGCGEPVVGSSVTPRCFRADPDAFVSAIRVTLEDVVIEEGAGAGIVLFPGAQADLRRVAVYGRELGGVLVWGATLRLTDSVIEANWAFGIELRSFPDPSFDAARAAEAVVERTSIRSTRALGGPVLGDGMRVRGGALAFMDSSVERNEGYGIAFDDAAAGIVSGSRVEGNAIAGICTAPRVSLDLTDATIGGNGAGEIARCR